MDMKSCSLCGEVRPLPFFKRDRSMSGRKDICWLCEHPVTAPDAMPDKLAEEIRLAAGAA